MQSYLVVAFLFLLVVVLIVCVDAFYPTSGSNHNQNNNHKRNMSHSPTSVIPTSSRSPTTTTMFQESSKKNDLGNNDTANPRSLLLDIGFEAGQLCRLANTHFPIISNGEIAPTFSSISSCLIVDCMYNLLRALQQLCQCLRLDMVSCIEKKIELNSKKYPVDLCKGKAGKYTQYSHATGVTKDNQSTGSPTKEPTADNNMLLHVYFSELSRKVTEFVTERDWAQYHTPRNIVLALLGETGELAELLQWTGDDFSASQLHDKDGDNDSNKVLLDKLGQEIADVSIYVMRLADICHLTDDLHRKLLSEAEEQDQQQRINE